MQPVYGFVQAVTYLAHKKQQMVKLAAVGLVTVTLASYVLVVKDMVELSPFEYLYFSPVIGGISGANGKFDTDYWATCSKRLNGSPKIIDTTPVNPLQHCKENCC